MTDKPFLLLVEGAADTAVFEVLLQKIDFPYKNKVTIGPPSKFGSQGDGKFNAMDLLPLEIDNLRDGKRHKIALIVDADFTDVNNGGFLATKNKLSKILKDKNYSLKEAAPSNNNSLVFSHNDGLANINVWVMPDNTSDGYLENFIKNNIVTAETSLFSNAAHAVESLKTPKFREKDTTKAEIATWMAWQLRPGQPLHGAVRSDLIDFTRGTAKEFIDWLDSCFL